VDWQSEKNPEHAFPQKPAGAIPVTSTTSRVNEIEVGIGDMKVASSPGVLITRNLGSCVGIALHDRYQKIGALIHVKLPRDHRLADTETHDTAEIFKIESIAAYADLALPSTLLLMSHLGSSSAHMTAKIAGGAQMFAIENPSMNIGKSNVEIIKRILKHYSIRLIGEDTGGDYGRTMRFDVTTGDVRLFSPGKGALVL
jgi:chemotaxis protein CheD